MSILNTGSVPCWAILSCIILSFTACMKGGGGVGYHAGQSCTASPRPFTACVRGGGTLLGLHKMCVCMGGGAAHAQLSLIL